MLELNVISPVLLWTAIAIYAAAFVAYAFDLARRSQATADAQNVRESVLVGAGGASIPAASGGSDAGSAPQRFVMARIGTSLTVLGFLFHLASAVTRGIAAGRVPWANL